jgi:hypothetical protein
MQVTTTPKSKSNQKILGNGSVKLPAQSTDGNAMEGRLVEKA